MSLLSLGLGMTGAQPGPVVNTLPPMEACQLSTPNPQRDPSGQLTLRYDHLVDNESLLSSSALWTIVRATAYARAAEYAFGVRVSRGAEGEHSRVNQARNYVTDFTGLDWGYCVTEALSVPLYRFEQSVCAGEAGDVGVATAFLPSSEGHSDWTLSSVVLKNAPNGVTEVTSMREMLQSDDSYVRTFVSGLLRVKEADQTVRGEWPTGICYSVTLTYSPVDE